MAAVKDNFKKFLLSSEFLFSMAEGFIGYMVSYEVKCDRRYEDALPSQAG